MEVVLTEFAEQSIHRIFLFYFDTASQEVASRMVEKIFTRIESLSKFVKRGRLEKNLTSLKQDHRFVLEGHFKIIYVITPQRVIVTDVFDTRQHPKKILKRAK